MGKAAHLTKRFFTSLYPGGPTKKADTWAQGYLSESERDLWLRMQRGDRRHAVGVARRVQDAYSGDAPTPVMAAALLHDVGKSDAHLGVYLRVVATLSAAVAGRDMAPVWADNKGLTRRIGLYLIHPELGGDMVALADSDPLVENWTRQHHLHEDRWTVDPDVGRILKEADDD